MKAKVIGALISICFGAGAAHATCHLGADDFEDLTGYEITGVKGVAGWVDKSAGETGDETEWEGCRYNRKIIFDDGTMLICEQYDSGRAWGAQEAVIFEKYNDIKVCIDDELYNVKDW